MGSHGGGSTTAEYQNTVQDTITVAHTAPSGFLESIQKVIDTTLRSILMAVCVFSLCRCIFVCYLGLYVCVIYIYIYIYIYIKIFRSQCCPHFCTHGC